jgi:hypothetical protein
MIKLNQFKHDTMDFFLKQARSDLAFEKLKFFKVSTNFIFGQNLKKWAKMTYLV